MRSRVSTSALIDAPELTCEMSNVAGAEKGETEAALAIEPLPCQRQRGALVDLRGVGVAVDARQGLRAAADLEAAAAVDRAGELGRGVDDDQPAAAELHGAAAGQGLNRRRSR